MTWSYFTYDLERSVDLVMDFFRYVHLKNFKEAKAMSKDYL